VLAVSVSLAKWMVESCEKQRMDIAIPHIVNTNFLLVRVAESAMFMKPDILFFIVVRN
jgi:hypothetical protein